MKYCMYLFVCRLDYRMGFWVCQIKTQQVIRPAGLLALLSIVSNPLASARGLHQESLFFCSRLLGMLLRIAFELSFRVASRISYCPRRRVMLSKVLLLFSYVTVCT